MTISARVLLRNAQRRWQLQQSEIDLPLDTSKGPSCFIFLPPDHDPGREIISPNFYSDFGVPPIITTEVCSGSNGFFGSKGEFDGEGRVKGYSTWFRCLVKSVCDSNTAYVWYAMTFLTKWRQTRFIVLCINTPVDFASCLQQSLDVELTSLNDQDPFAMLSPLVGAITMLYNRSVWSIRDLIRQVEIARGREAEADFTRLHEIARHAIHATETLTVTSQSLDIMRQRHEDLVSGGHGHEVLKPFHEGLDFQAQLIRNMKQRSQANEERIRNEITFAYNMIAQRDSKVMLDIGRATRSDSSAMKAVAVVTMAFLPATFVSAVFSMSFFNFSPASGDQPSQWRVSSSVWIYWVIAIPLTGLTVATWLRWQGNLRLGNGLKRLYVRRAVKETLTT